MTAELEISSFGRTAEKRGKLTRKGTDKTRFKTK